LLWTFAAVDQQAADDVDHVPFAAASCYFDAHHATMLLPCNGMNFCCPWLMLADGPSAAPHLALNGCSDKNLLLVENALLVDATAAGQCVEDVAKLLLAVDGPQLLPLDVPCCPC
ncbi:hypothetical protein ACLOJK_006627, partial [Asimina triloba]